MKRSFDSFFSSTYPIPIYNTTQQVKVSSDYDEGLDFGEGRALPLEI